MATKFGLAGGIPERRVRPIWDAVDSRQFKAALKLSVALLAKYPDSPYALALKALVLERMGKPVEALSVCLNAKDIIFENNVHVDDLTLSTLQIVFQRLDRLDLATSCYEHACGKYPNNLEIMMGLFICYVREYSYVKQQQTAIKMYKVAAEERFLLWAVCSIQLQVCCLNGGEKLLLLAEALLKKHIASHGLHEPEALLTYISVLEQQEKYTTALEVISGNLGSLIGIEVDKLCIQGRLLSRVRDYVAAAEVFQKVMELCPDDWTAFLDYLGCLLEDDVSCSNGSGAGQIHTDFQRCKIINLSKELFDLRIESASLFVKKLQKDAYEDYTRCPYLADIEIERQRRLFGKPDDGKLIEALLKYVDRFSHLSCFTSDVQIFINILTHDEKAELLEAFVKLSGSTSTISLKSMSQAITVFKMQDLLGGLFDQSVEELEAIAIKMIVMFCENLPLSRDLDPQENMHGEELLSMACNVLVQLFWRTHCMGYLLEAVLVLEFGLTIRRFIWQYKVLLVHLYSLLGDLPSAHQWYGTLDIKNILLETASHHIMPQLLASPLWLETTELLNDYTKFLTDHLREAADLASLAYRHRNYSRVIEFVKFKERLLHSHQYLSARLDASFLQLKQKSDNLEDIECVLENMNFGLQTLELSSEEELKLLTFNDDLQTRPWWTPVPAKNLLLEPFQGKIAFLSPNPQDQHLANGEQEFLAKKALTWKSLLPRMLHLSLQVTSLPPKENFEPHNCASATNDDDELEGLLDRFARNLDLSFADATRMIIEISDGQKTLKDCSSDVVQLVTLAVFLNASNLGYQKTQFGSKEHRSKITWSTVENLIEKCVAEQLLCARPMLTYPGSSSFPVLVQLLTEPLSWHILIIQSSLRSILPSGKKKKRISTGMAEHPNSPQLQSICRSIGCLSQVIQAIRDWLSSQIDRPEDGDVDVLLSHLDKDGCKGPGRIIGALEANAFAPSLDLGDRISSSLRSWSSVDVVRKIVGGQHKLLSRFRHICDSKTKVLESMKQSIPI